MLQEDEMDNLLSSADNIFYTEVYSGYEEHNEQIELQYKNLELLRDNPFNTTPASKPISDIKELIRVDSMTCEIVFNHTWWNG